MQLIFGNLLVDRIRGLVQRYKFERSQSASPGSYRSETSSDSLDIPSTENSDVFPPEFELTRHEDEPDRLVYPDTKKTRDHIPLSRYSEVIDEVTPGRLRSLINITLKTRSAEPTKYLTLRGNYTMQRPVSARKIRRLGIALPSIKQLTVEGVNLCARGRNRQVSLEDFPATLTTLSVRDSVVDMTTFLSSRHHSAFINIRVLDLGGTINTRGKVCEWPQMDNLEELYIEGARGLSSGDFLQNVLNHCPSLKTIDLEGADVDSGALAVLASCAIRLEKLFLGFTEIRDGTFYLLNKCNLSFPSLEVLCLADTYVTKYGLHQICRAAPKLREVTVNRRMVSEQIKEERSEDVFLRLRVHRVCNVHVGAVFRDQGCGHFKAVYATGQIPSMLPPLVE